jgi:hypothetical protein
MRKIKLKITLLKAVVFIDYENIWMHFQQYGSEPLALNFFPVILDRLKKDTLKVIKSENRLAYLFSSRLGFNNVKAEYCDYHEYLEDIFHLTPEMLKASEERDYQNNKAQDYPSSIENAREVTKWLFNSNIWKECEKSGEPVTLKGYVIVISKVVKRSPSRIIADFRLASELGYVKIVNDSRKGDCLRRGENYKEILDNNQNGMNEQQVREYIKNQEMERWQRRSKIHD